VQAQPDAVKRINDEAVAPTMAASNAVMANIAALELIKHITGAGNLTLLGHRMLLDLTNYTTTIG
jgi:molybdopterin/thiamine biosynthesis adenylyltransferase